MPNQQQLIQVPTEAELFPLLVENVKDFAIFVVDQEGLVRSWNPGAERLLGYSEHEIVGKPSDCFYTAEDLQNSVAQRQLEKAAKTGRGEDDRWHVRKDGSRFWSEGTITPLWNEGRDLRGFAKIMRDRTSQKHADEALKDALAHTNEIVDTVREPLIVLGGDLRVKTANRSFYQIFRVSPGETEGRLIYRLGDGQWDIPRLRTLLEEILPQHTSFDGFEVEHDFGTIGRKVMLLNARRLRSVGNQTELILLAIEDITERRRAEEGRNEIETRFTSLVKNIKDHSIFTTDANGRVTSWNVAAERILGYSEAEILGQPFSVIFTSDDQQNDVPGRELRIATEEGRGEDLRWHVRKGGERFWAVGIVTPMRDTGGRLTGFSKILRDMTEQKLVEEKLQRAHASAETRVLERTAELRTAYEGLQKGSAERRVQEEALRKSEERFQELTANIDQVLWAMDAQQGEILYVSRGYERMWDRSARSLLDAPRSYLEGIHPQDQERMAREFADMFHNGTIDVECRILRPDESVRWIWIRGYPVAEQGRIVRVVGVIEDVTEKRLLTGQRAALLSRLEIHIERMPLAYILFDAGLSIADWNPAAERIFGYTKREALGKTTFDLAPSSYRAKAEELLGRIRKGDMGAHSVHENLTKDRRKITCEWFNTPLHDDDGSFAGILCLAQDVTERKALEEQFRQAQKMEAIGNLAGGIAHDFNNLLTIINGYSEIIQTQLTADNPMREWVRQIGQAGERAASLTRQLLAFSRKQLLEPKVLNLNAVVTDTAKMLQRLIGEDVDLNTVLEPGLGRVKADRGQIEQILINLAVNARDAMPLGGKLTIETVNVELDETYNQVRTDVRPGHYALLAFTDTGCGMDQATKARIFEPFFTTKEPGKGTGIGLATVFGIVKQSEGHIAVYSEAGLGASFKIYLPVVEAIVSATTAESDVTARLRGTETILLTEDESALRALASHVLQMHGYTVIEASQGEKALRAAEEYNGTIHLLVTDVVMPVMSGRQLAENLVAARPNLKVLYISGYTDDAVVRHGVLRAEAAFLQKPFTPSALAVKVREVLDQ